MDRRAKLVALGVLAASCSSHAFVSPSPPPGFGGAPGNWTWSPPSPTEQLGKIMRGPGPKIPNGPVAGGAYRLGPGAARALAGGVARGLIPGLGLALGVAWLAENCIGKENGQWVRTCGPGLPSPIVDGYEYKVVYNGGNWATWHATKQGACEVGAAYHNATLSGVGREYRYTDVYTRGGYCYGKAWNVIDGVLKETYLADFAFDELVSRTAECPIGWYSTPAGCVQSPPPVVMTPEEVEAEMAPKPLPPVLPNGVPYPLDPTSPFIFEPDTSNPPKARPLRVPQGNPVPIPNTNPQKYRQPTTVFTPSPTLDDPFRLDVRPEDVVGESPTGIQQPMPIPPGSGSPSGEKPEQFDLCKEHPDIIACQVFRPDELTPTPVPNKQVPLALNKEGGFPTGGGCPQPKSLAILGTSFEFSMQPLCDLAAGIKPILIGFAWLTAAMTFLGVARREN